MNDLFNDMKSVVIESGQPGPELLISAGVHGDEYEPMLAASALARNLPGQLCSGSVRIVTVVNKSAYMQGDRLGKDGFDLARICPGKPIGSDSEVSAYQISELIRSSDYYIDMHTGGRLFQIHPLAGYTLHKSAEILSQQRRMAIAFNLPVVWGTDSAPDGRTLSVARDARVPAIYVEYGGGSPINKEIVKAYYEGCVNVLRSLHMMRAEKSTDRAVKYWVEDDSPDSGHLQAKMPSPMSGIFIPEARVGEKINKGQVWGVIADPVSGEEKEAMADKDGIALFLRATPFVQQGQSLGGILPISNLMDSSV